MTRALLCLPTNNAVPWLGVTWQVPTAGWGSGMGPEWIMARPRCGWMRDSFRPCLLTARRCSQKSEVVPTGLSDRPDGSRWRGLCLAMFSCQQGTSGCGPSACRCMQRWLSARNAGPGGQWRFDSAVKRGDHPKCSSHTWHHDPFRPFHQQRWDR